MNIITLPLATALVAGFTHALEADHMAAVTAFVSRRPHPLRALGFGVRWGLGHSLALLVVGGVVIALDVQLSAALAHWLERAVGVMLVGLGLWAMAGVLHRLKSAGAHEQAHTEGHGHSHLHGQGTTLVGAFHGLAGTAAFLALLPVAFISSPWLASGYLVVFGVGSVIAMGLYALLAGLLLHHVGESAPALGAGMRVLGAVASLCVGLFWLLGA